MTTTTRARPLTPEQRRASIIDAVVPLILEHGTAVTSRQIADAAGVAEGTVFRAFGDKESLIEAAADAVLDGGRLDDGPLPDPDAPLESKLRDLLHAMRHRVRDVMRMAALTGRHPQPPTDAQRAVLRWRLREIFGPHESELTLTLDDLGAYLRAIAIGTSIPAPDHDLSDDLIVTALLDGIRRRRPAED